MLVYTSRLEMQVCIANELLHLVRCSLMPHILSSFNTYTAMNKKDVMENQLHWEVSFTTDKEK